MAWPWAWARLSLRRPPATRCGRRWPHAPCPLRSIDPLDTTYEDLLPPIFSIGDARIVRLGEPSHGSGGTFSARARVIKFLHERMDFDMVAWESGMHALQATEAALGGSQNPVAAMMRGSRRTRPRWRTNRGWRTA